MSNATLFTQFNLHPYLQQALATAKLTEPTPVQQQAVPAALKGADIMAAAPTGTGKTAAFMLPSLHKIFSGPSSVVRGRGPRVLVLTPTRELAQQVLTASRMLSAAGKVRSGLIVGGVGYSPQFQMLAGPLDLLVATPGRLIDHLQQGRIDFSRIEIVVLDEADKMLDMGFLKPVEQIISKINASAPRPQMFLFTATQTASVEKFARTVLREPVKVTLAPARSTPSQIEQLAYRADNQNHKLDMLQNLLNNEIKGQAIVFSATKHGADKLAEKLTQFGIPSAPLHGGMVQNKRTKTLAMVHSGQVRVLVATDVAARGIDVKALSHVVNFDLPQVAEDYVHRIGRTGRAGESGVAISLISPSDVPMLRDIEKLLGRPMKLAHLPGHEPSVNEADFLHAGKLAPRSRKTQRSGPRQGQGSGHGARPQGSSGGFKGGQRSFSQPSSGSAEGSGGASNGGGYQKRSHAGKRFGAPAGGSGASSRPRRSFR